MLAKTPNTRMTSRSLTCRKWFDGFWRPSSIYNVKNDEDLHRIQEGYDKLQFFLRAYFKAGGQILAGSDTFYSVPGLSLQRELNTLVDAGFSPMQVIVMATRQNAEFLGKGTELGTIAESKLADIVVLDENPLRDIHNIRKVGMVFKRGQAIETAYHTDYRGPVPKPTLVRPRWVERQIQHGRSGRRHAL